ncbi:phospholipase [Leptotrichia sp. OH3620_COT-345]|uniref:phospholipase D-like domain-containing protein n=1 Tax=Leptotrichia sp. OH3620_COT-345 TaxID=2491048 RepID=UPI000F654DDD|nr:phospholipase D-like domain-containing protein [Leptotrichia sp. OH3620_COT-345]RRD40996.1 phospholipase [Leptotrichia sp. OH3620_COT-345]
MTKLKFIFFNIFIFLFLLSCVSLPQGLSYKSKIYNADNVDFYYDLTYKKNGKIQYERQIWEQAYNILDNAKEFFLMDIFVFNDFLGKGVKEKLEPLNIAEEFSEKILEKRKKDPNVEIYLILDESNTFYGAFDNKTHKKLEEAGVKIGYVDLAKLRDPMPVYSTPWRLFIRPFGNPKNKGKIKNPVYEGTDKVTVRSILRALNAKANHRKLIMNENTAMLTSANPHAEGSKHSNVAFKFSSPILKEIYSSEQAAAKITKSDGSLKQHLPNRDFSKIPISDNTKIRLQYFTEGQTAADISKELSLTTIGDKIIIAQFFLADRGIINDIKKAAKRGADIQVILNNSNAGVPNKAAAGNLMKYARKHNYKIEIKFYNKGEEMYHVKMLSILKKDYIITYGGSTNFTRRNMRNYNLENEIKIISTYDQNISKNILDYYDRLWTNKDGDFTLPYEQHKNEKITNDLLFRFMEINGFGIF